MEFPLLKVKKMPTHLKKMFENKKVSPPIVYGGRTLCMVTITKEILDRKLHFCEYSHLSLAVATRWNPKRHT